MNCDKGILTHKHHIMPKYMGGSDDPSNLIEVSITRHAMFHFCNYQLWGNDEDRIAYLGLSKQIGSDEIILEKMRLGTKKMAKIIRHRIATEPEFARRIYEGGERGRRKCLSEEVKIKRKKKFKLIKHQQGTKNSQYGTRWIYNLELRQNKKISNEEEVPSNWSIGRILNFDIYFKKIEDKNKRQKERIKEKQEKIKYYENLYEIYITKGFSHIKENLNYTQTQESLIKQFKKYVKNYVPYDKARSGIVG